VEWTIPATATDANFITPSIPSEAVFANLPNVTSTPIANNVRACQMFAIPCVNTATQMQRPSLEVILQISGGNPSVPPQVVYTTVALRAPNPNPQ